MTALLVAEHDNKSLKDFDQQGAHRGQGARRRRPRAGRGRRLQGGGGRGRQARRREEGAAGRRSGVSTCTGGAARGADCFAGRPLRRDRCPGHDQRQERHAARGGAARRHASV